ncbi:MAG: ABC transporter substrate-binding protein [Pseudomonadota bacterium]
MRPYLYGALLLAGGLSAGPAAALDCEDGMRAFEHHAGTTCIPVDPQRIVTLQDQNAMLPLLELGVTPVGSVGWVNPEGEQVFRRIQGYDASDVTFVGSYRGADKEAVAAVQPDLILATPWPPNAVEEFSAIAPVVVIDMFDQPMEDALMQFADAVNQTRRAEELRAEWEAHLVAAKEELGDKLQTTTVSVVTYDGEVFRGQNPIQAAGMVFRGLELRRPAYEMTLGSTREERSWEAIQDHEADVMILFVSDQTGDVVHEFMEHPAVKATGVGQAGQVFHVNSSEVFGVAWGKGKAGVDAFVEVIGRADLDRDLIQEPGHN